MDIFTAVAEPTRRSIIELLATGGQLTATQISSKFPSSAAAISQHLKVLKDTEVVLMEKRAQQRLYQVNPAAMQQLEVWIKRMTERMEECYSALDALLIREQAKKSKE